MERRRNARPNRKRIEISQKTVFWHFGGMQTCRGRPVSHRTQALPAFRLRGRDKIRLGVAQAAPGLGAGLRRHRQRSRAAPTDERGRGRRPVVRACRHACESERFHQGLDGCAGAAAAAGDDDEGGGQAGGEMDVDVPLQRRRYASSKHLWS